MASPFVFDEPVTGEELIGRAAERRDLGERLLDARNARLEGPRRHGKTSLLRAVLDDVRPAAAAAIEVNFFGCTSAGEVAERIERAYAAALDRPLRRWLDSVLRTLHPTIEAAPAGVGVSVTPQVSTRGLLDRLALPLRVQERTGKVTIVAFDEFQEVLRVHPSLPGVFRSEIERHGRAAGYLFSGSHPGLMRELFADRRHAFFAQAGPVEVGLLPPVELADVIDRRFQQHRRDLGSALGPLLDAAAGHPQRAMLLAHHLFLATPTGAIADEEIWHKAESTARREAGEEIELLWAGASRVERGVLKAVATRDVSPTSTEARRLFGLSRGGTVTDAVARLIGAGHLVRDKGRHSGLRVVDPFVAHWLSHPEEQAR